MSKKIKLALVAAVAAVSLGGLAPVANASDCEANDSVCHVVEAKDHVGRAIHNILNPR